MTGPRKLLAAAAMSMTAACAAPRPAVRSVAYPQPVTEAAATTTAPAPVVIENVVAAPVPEAAAPRCDEHGRPLAGNVQKKSMDDCS